MFVVIYQWKLKAGQESHFREGWRRVTRALIRHRGGLGSRLHEGEAGVWIAYAQWPDKASWEKSVELGPINGEPGYEMMEESIDRAGSPSSPRYTLAVVDDLFKPEMNKLSTV